MSNVFPMKTFADSYLYNASSRNSSKANNKAITDFIIKSHRINKNEPAFAGVIEDIKRHQSSAILVSILMNPSVILCINEMEMPAAFKVFDAKDSKDNNRPKVFIDLTGKLEYKDGYYIIRRNEADKICALLYDALIYLLYRNQRFKLTNNANIVLASTNCYVSMFNYVLDYLRIIGFSQSKSKISYITALFYLHSMIGYPIDDPYAKSIATKVAQITPREANAYDLFIDDESQLSNIAEFIAALVKMFRLKGLDLSVFVQKWIASFGTGTEYATELFTSFLVVLVNAYSGSYILRQRQISMACGDANLVKVANAIIHAGADSYGNTYAEGVDLRTVHSKTTESLAESMKLKDEILAKGIYINKFDNVEQVSEDAKNIINKCKAANIPDRIAKYANSSLINGIGIAYESAWSILHGEDSDYCCGALIEAYNNLGSYLADKDRYNLNIMLYRDINHLSNLLEDYSDLPSDIKKEVSTIILDLKKCK